MLAVAGIASSTAVFSVPGLPEQSLRKNSACCCPWPALNSRSGSAGLESPEDLPWSENCSNPTSIDLGSSRYPKRDACRIGDVQVIQCRPISTDGLGNSTRQLHQSTHSCWRCIIKGQVSLNLRSSRRELSHSSPQEVKSPEPSPQLEFLLRSNDEFTIDAQHACSRNTIAIVVGVSTHHTQSLARGITNASPTLNRQVLHKQVLRGRVIVHILWRRSPSPSSQTKSHN